MSPQSSPPPISDDQQQHPSPPSPKETPAAPDVRNGTNDNNGKTKEKEKEEEKEKEKEKDKDATTPVVQQNGRVRPTRACTVRTAARLQAAAQQAALEKRPKVVRREKKQRKKKEEEEDEEDEEVDDDMLISEQCGSSKVITPLVGPPEPSQLPRWGLRSMWELASILNFLHVRPKFLFLCRNGSFVCKVLIFLWKK